MVANCDNMDSKCEDPIVTAGRDSEQIKDLHIDYAIYLLHGCSIIRVSRLLVILSQSGSRVHEKSRQEAICMQDFSNVTQ